MKKNKLICVNGDVNSNKYYHMEQVDNDTFHVKYGRVAGSETTEIYPMSKWDSIYQKKTTRKNNPYKDVTELFAESTNKVQFREISSSTIRRIINDLQSYAKQSIIDNYTVSSASVTEKQVNIAQEVIDKLSSKTKLEESVKEINNLLLELYQIIPRKLKKVQEHLVQNGTNLIINKSNLDFLKEIVTNEQQTLDVMRGQVQLSIQTNSDSKEVTLLDSFGLKVEEINETEKQEIIQLLSDSANYFSSAIKVMNIHTQSRFNEWLNRQNDKRIKSLIHGSRNENFLNIAKIGLLIHPSNAVLTGALFGMGIYFANRAKKSIGYTSLENSYWAKGFSKKAYLGIFDVHTGNSFILKENDMFRNKTDYQYLKNSGYDSLWAKRGYNFGYSKLQNDEITVYKKEQCTIKYLVEIKI